MVTTQQLLGHSTMNQNILFILHASCLFSRCMISVCPRLSKAILCNMLLFLCLAWHFLVEHFLSHILIPCLIHNWLVWTRITDKTCYFHWMRGCFLTEGKQDQWSKHIKPILRFPSKVPISTAQETRSPDSAWFCFEQIYISECRKFVICVFTWCFWLK